MRFHRPLRWPGVPRSRQPLPGSPATPLPRQPPEGDNEPPAAGRWSWLSALTTVGIGWLSRYKVLAGALTTGAVVVLLGFGFGFGTDTAWRGAGSGSATADAADAAAAERAVAADRAAAQRAADDKASAERVAAAKAADARAAEERAARALAAERERARKQVVAMPALVGLKLDIAMDVATDAGLTDISVCRTPGDDIPLWWPNWRIVAQDVRVGAKVSAGQEICLSARKD